nr:MerR family transcriptional regulator [uncultured Catonella sp.]
MLRNEVQSRTGLTRKAIEYYEERGLINPKKSENGYRDYREKDLQILTKISLYRKVGLNIAEIENVLNSDLNTLSATLRKKQRELEIQEKRKDILELIVKGEEDNIIQEKLAILENEEIIYEKLERAFPGYFGMMIFSAYQPFLNEPLSEDSKSAYTEYVKYLDNLPQFELSEEEQKYIEKNTSDIKLADLKGVSDARIKAVENFEKWWDENKDIVEKYEEFKKSDEYTNSLMKQIQDKLQKYIQENNYYDIAIPLRLGI